MKIILEADKDSVLAENVSRYNIVVAVKKTNIPLLLERTILDDEPIYRWRAFHMSGGEVKIQSHSEISEAIKELISTGWLVQTFYNLFEAVKWMQAVGISGDVR